MQNFWLFSGVIYGSALRGALSPMDIVDRALQIYAPISAQYPEISLHYLDSQRVALFSQLSKLQTLILPYPKHNLKYDCIIKVLSDIRIMASV